MTLIGLVRHGTTVWNLEGRLQGQTDIGLHESGVAQANALGERLKSGRWDAVVSSDLSRAAQTAGIVAGKIGISRVHEDARLRERSFGLLEGTTLEERVRRWGEHWKTVELGVESDESVGKRARDCVMDLCARYPHGNVVVVTHGGLIRQLLRTLFGDKYAQTPLKNSSLTVVKKLRNDWECELFNCTAHLDGDTQVLP